MVHFDKYGRINISELAGHLHSICKIQIDKYIEKIGHKHCIDMSNYIIECSVKISRLDSDLEKVLYEVEIKEDDKNKNIK